jgi:DNA-binding MarR family transcriptional regulator
VNRADASAEIADLVAAVSRRIRNDAKGDLGPLGVTWAQVRALRTLARAADPVRMSDLAARLDIARRSATSVVDELAERGLVERRDDPVDRRTVAVVVTERGVRLLEKWQGRRRAAALAITAGLSTSELETLQDLLARLVPSGYCMQS